MEHTIYEIPNSKTAPPKPEATAVKSKKSIITNAPWFDEVLQNE